MFSPQGKNNAGQPNNQVVRRPSLKMPGKLIQTHRVAGSQESTYFVRQLEQAGYQEKNPLRRINSPGTTRAKERFSGTGKKSGCLKSQGSGGITTAGKES
jgi:hypothetical protein